jgi:hypothetical protein
LLNTQHREFFFNGEEELSKEQRRSHPAPTVIVAALVERLFCFLVSIFIWS